MYQPFTFYNVKGILQCKDYLYILQCKDLIADQVRECNVKAFYILCKDYLYILQCKDSIADQVRECNVKPFYILQSERHFTM